MGFSIMASININFSVEIFTKVSGYSARELESSNKNSRSTQVPITMNPINAGTYLSFTEVVDVGKLCSDQTGHFPVASITGVKYVFILYSYNANAIFSDPLKSRTGK